MLESNSKKFGCSNNAYKHTIKDEANGEENKKPTKSERAQNIMLWTTLLHNWQTVAEESWMFFFSFPNWKRIKEKMDFCDLVKSIVNKSTFVNVRSGFICIYLFFWTRSHNPIAVIELNNKYLKIELYLHWHEWEI